MCFKKSPSKHNIDAHLKYMKPTNELFLLIKSLNKNEKGYFKKFASINSKSGEGNYLRLFDCIDQMHEYDEKQIRKKFAGEKFLQQLNVTKLYLQKMIVKSLRNYHADTDPDIERLNTLVEVHMLIKKHMYDTAYRYLQKAREKMSAQETQLAHLQAIQMQYQIMLRKGMYEEILATNEVKLQTELSEIERYKNLCEYRYLQRISMSKTQIDGYTQTDITKEMKLLLEHPLLKNKGKAISFKAKMHRYEILNKCYLKIGDAKKAYQSATDLCMLFKHHPDKIKSLPYNYFVALNSLANRCISVFNYTEAELHIEEINKVLQDEQLPLSDSQRFEIATQMLEKKLIVLGGLYKFEEAVKTEQQLTKYIGNKPIRAELQATIMYFSALCYFGLDKHKEALLRINRLVNDNFDNIRKDIVIAAHAANVLIHLDLKNHSLVKRLIKVFQNFAQKHDFNSANLEHFASSIQKLNLSIAKGKSKEIKKQIHYLLHETTMPDFLDEDIYKWWLNKKLNEWTT